VGADFPDPSPMKNNDPIGILDCGEAVGNDNGRAAAISLVRRPESATPFRCQCLVASSKYLGIVEQGRAQMPATASGHR
jgi:hypothetical protein